MRNRLMRIVTLVVGTVLLNTGCILSQAVDRNYLGVNVPAANTDRKLTGLFLLPFATVLDVLTLPVQAGAVLTYGDDFPYRYQGQEEGTLTPYRGNAVQSAPQAPRY
ncbi:MAG: hypothetical protein ABTS16_11930 [Candidatus Accumulibacter phosphatis]|jgi:hypothetical protein|uniref:YceK/YidQ family lipoprotein n=1 Tax=Candidatus Accumulibacter contiguus TaxID=2954381 RepID=A0ABX1TBG8_9PROT|nr:MULTISPECIES: hypothetical protein [Candidatus Accumulibacter]MBL8407745.1 hypothetical protein [Accumulibacter sp.]NMQ06999.1 hypothetical protein [Candidatus Accumulibacter contiguus]